MMDDSQKAKGSRFMRGAERADGHVREGEAPHYGYHEAGHAIVGRSLPGARHASTSVTPCSVGRRRWLTIPAG